MLEYSRRADGRPALGAAAARVAGRRPPQVPGLGAEAGAALAAHAGVDKISFTGSGVRPLAFPPSAGLAFGLRPP